MPDAAILVLTVLAAVTAGLFLWTWIDERRRPRVVCLLYHRFAIPADHDRLTGAERVFQVPLDRFEAQLRWLQEAGYHAVTADQMAAFVTTGTELPQPAVHITIDDGSLSVLEHAAPLLKRYGSRATLFLTTDADAHIFTASDERRMTEDEVRALDPAVIEVECHGVTHRPLVTLDDAELQQELEGCRADVRRLVARPAEYLAIPGGWYDRRVRRAAAAAGFRAVWVSDAGTNRAGRDPLGIRRLNVDGFAGPGDFAALFRPLSVAQLRFFSALKRLPGKLLGPRRWLPLRRQLRGLIRAEALSFRSLRRVGVAVAAVIVVVAAWWFLSR